MAAAKREPVILWEGECAYAVREGDAYKVVVFSTNHVQHVQAGVTDDGARAESVCRRLNAYPRQTRQFHGLI